MSRRQMGCEEMVSKLPRYWKIGQESLPLVRL